MSINNLTDLKNIYRYKKTPKNKGLMEKRKYDTSRPVVIPGVPIKRVDWNLLKKIAAKKGILAWAALGEAVREWNERNSFDK